jgi:hypothetical protein
MKKDKSFNKNAILTDDDKSCNEYMETFEGRYVLTKIEENETVIKGKWGFIAPYDLKNKTLGIWTNINLTTNRRNLLLAHIKPYIISVFQDCDDSFGANFNVENLDNVCAIIKAKIKKEKKQLTPEQLQVLRERMNIARASRIIKQKNAPRSQAC